MASGDFALFAQFGTDLAEQVHNLETDTIKLALVTSSVTPTATTADPRWGAGGSTNLSSSQVTPGGNYSTGGATLANPSVVLASSTTTVDADDPATWSQNASNPTNARWGILYNDTAAGKNCIGFLDLGSTVDMTAADLDVNVGASGILRILLG